MGGVKMATQTQINKIDKMAGQIEALQYALSKKHAENHRLIELLQAAKDKMMAAVDEAERNE
jgi:hypothetical protein